MKQDKNFTVRLQAIVEKKMREAGIFDLMLNGATKFGQFDRVENKFFDLLKKIKLSDLNKDTGAPAEVGKQYWLATAARLDGAGILHGPFMPFDGPHDNPAGVAKALKLHQGIKAIRKPAGALFCMLEVSPVPDLPVQVNQEAVDTLNSLCPHGRSIGPHHDCPLRRVGQECQCIKDRHSSAPPYDPDADYSGGR